MPVTPMFPLGTVLLPGMPLPLRIFEPRYRELLADVLANDGRFGVVLIERGNEVGGGDTRCSVGTLAEIQAHREIDTDQHVVLATGTERFRVDHWLSDAPYPRAEATAWPDADSNAELQTATNQTRDPDLARRYDETASLLRRLLAAAVENGHQVAAATFDAPEDPVAGSYLLSMLTPVGSFDRQRLLEAPGATERLRLLSELITDQRLLVDGGR